MNYLAHLFLGPKDPEQALGSLLGDFVRGPVHSLDLPHGVREGIWLHRRIDAFTDAHPLVRRSRERVSAERRRYAGIMIDMFYDHLLAKHWLAFSDQPLEYFTRDIYRLLLEQQAVIQRHGGTGLAVQLCALDQFASSTGQHLSAPQAQQSATRFSAGTGT